MAGLLDDLFLQPDGSEDDEDEDDEDDDSDLELVEVGAEDPQGAEQPPPPPAAPLVDKAPAVQPSIRSFFRQQ